jgi:hypothetical protein
MSLTDYKIDPKTGICTKVSTIPGTDVTKWKPCLSSQVNTKVADATLPGGSAPKGEDDKDKKCPDGTPATAFDKDGKAICTEQSKPGNWKPFVIVGGIVLGVAVLAIVAYLGIKAASKAKPPTPPVV